MKLPTETINHDGEEYTISYESWFTCLECDKTWEDTRENTSRVSCPRCGESTDLSLEKRAHYYMKTSAIPLKDPPKDAKVHADALRNTAAEFEALDANGWELTETDGVHIYFVTDGVVDTDNPHQIDSDLE